MPDLLLASTKRQIDHPVEPIFPNRWSPRAMNGAHITQETLNSLFEAARWAPSSSNNQPWRFIYALRSSDAWPAFIELLFPNNQTWCKQAAALILMVSKQTFENGKPSLTHSFDCGAAWMSLALQGSLLGLVMHGMQGFDYGKAIEVVGLPDGYSVEAICAVGYPGSAEDLPEALRVRELPSARKSVGEFAFEGKFPA